MNGIEKIMQQIDAEAQVDIDRVLSAAREEAAGITARYKAQADKDAAELALRNEKAAAERENRLVSTAQMEARKVALSARQDMVNLAFDKALEKMCAMPDDQYVKIAAALMVQAAPNGAGSVMFSKADQKRVGAAAVEKANGLLGGKGKLKLSDETRDLRGGFILTSGSVEVNCAFETLVRLQKNEITGEVAKCLFAD